MSEIKTLAFIVNETNYPLAVAALLPDFALIPVSEVYGEIIVLNDLFTVDTEDRGRVVAIGNAHYEAEDFLDTFAVEGDILDGQLHAVRRI